jgi:hypothetical protein
MAEAGTTVPVSSGDLRTLQLVMHRMRQAIYRDARMHRGDKIYLYAQLEIIDGLCEKYLQLDMFSPAQRG